MTAAERLIWNRVQRRASEFQPEIAAAILRSFRTITEAMSEAQIIRAIQLGGVERLFQEALTQAVFNVAYAPVREKLRWSIAQSVKVYTPPPKIMGQLSVSFDYLNPRVIDAIRTLETKVIQNLEHDAKEVVRAIVENGLRDGHNPRAYARQLRSSVGLGPTQLQEVENYRRALMEKDASKALHYLRRDKRYDRLTKDGKMTPERIDKAVDAYTRRRIALNAETNARTAALDAQKLAQRLSYEDAIAKGVVSRDQLKREWIGVMDAREREEHRAMEGQQVGFDSPFSNGEMEPGESTYNCRCIARITLAA